jgi:hypothetical protein
MIALPVLSIFSEIRGMTADITREEFEARVGVLEREVKVRKW